MLRVNKQTGLTEYAGKGSEAEMICRAAMASATRVNAIKLAQKLIDRTPEVRS